MDWTLFITNVLSAGISRGTPILFATLGETISERSGILNLGVEGMMLLGAMTGYGICHLTGNPWLGLLVGVLASGLLSLVHAFMTISLRADQVVSGLSLVFLGSGLASVIGSPLIEVQERVARLPRFDFPLLSQIPFIGDIFFRHSIIIYFGFIAVPIIWFFIHRTRPGLHLRAIGENPASADTLGVNVFALRYLYVFIGGCFAGLGGASLSLAITPGWIEGMTAGQGWIAIGLVIFARWDPLRAAAGSYLFGAIRRLPLDLQGIPGPFFKNPNLGYFLDMLPYAFTIIVLIIVSGETVRKRMGAPAALAIPYTRGERGIK
jgi:simple sugar transport system permease protein